MGGPALKGKSRGAAKELLALLLSPLPGLTNHCTTPTAQRGSVAFSPVGELLVTASGTKVWLWEAKGFRSVRRLPDAVRVAKFSPAGKFLVTGATNGLLQWDTETWSVAAKLEAELWKKLESPFKWGLSFSPDGRRTAVGCEEGIKLLNTLDFKETAMRWEPMPRLPGRAKGPNNLSIRLGKTRTPESKFTPQRSTDASRNAIGGAFQVGAIALPLRSICWKNRQWCSVGCSNWTQD